MEKKKIIIIGSSVAAAVVAVVVIIVVVVFANKSKDDQKDKKATGALTEDILKQVDEFDDWDSVGRLLRPSDTGVFQLDPRATDKSTSPFKALWNEEPNKHADATIEKCRGQCRQEETLTFKAIDADAKSSPIEFQVDISLMTEKKLYPVVMKNPVTDTAPLSLCFMDHLMVGVKEAMDADEELKKCMIVVVGFEKMRNGAPEGFIRPPFVRACLINEAKILRKVLKDTTDNIIGIKPMKSVF
jgi:hypothetical protein